MKIMMLRSDIKLAGPGILIKYYSEKLLEKGHEVVICSGGGVLNNTINNSRIRYYQIEELLISKRGIYSNIKAIYKLWKILREEKIEVIHCHNAYVAILAYISSIFSLKQIRIINTVHGVGKEWVNRFLPMKIMVVSNYVKNRLLAAKVKENKIVVLENGVIDLETYNIENTYKNIREEIGVKQEEYLIGVVGIMTGKKGHIEAIHTFEEILKLNSNKCFKLCLVGDGPLQREYEQYCKEKNLEKDIIFLGRRNDIPAIMKSLDMLIHLSSSETFGMVLVEAMAMGKVVVASNLGGIPEIIEDGENGFLVDKDKFYENARLIKEISNNIELIARIKENNLKKVKESYLLNNTIEKLLKIYESL